MKWVSNFFVDRRGEGGMVTLWEVLLNSQVLCLAVFCWEPLGCARARGSALLGNGRHAGVGMPDRAVRGVYGAQEEPFRQAREEGVRWKHRSLLSCLL